MSETVLSAETDISIRFSDVDMMGIVWHGNYAKYFEDGRRGFGKKYGFNFQSALDEGFTTPVVKLDISYKKPLKYNDPVRIETIFLNTEAAKIQYTYKIYHCSTGELMTTGSTTQVFLDHKNRLRLTLPETFIEWKKKWGLI